MPSLLRVGTVVVLALGAVAPRDVAAQSISLSFPSSAHAEPITGRAFVFVARTGEREPRLQSGASRTSEPFFGKDIEALMPGAPVRFDRTVPGYPLASLADLPAGDYYVQGLILPYTRFARSDGHTIWAHMDAGEGQRFNRAPGSLVSDVVKVRINPSTNSTTSLALTAVIPPVDTIEDTPWVKRFQMTSKLASAFWGHDMPLGAVVLLPKGVHREPEQALPGGVYDRALQHPGSVRLHPGRL